MIIKKKIDIEYFEEILSEIKTFEIRLNEFECNPGDTLLLKEKDPKTKILTGRTIEKTIVHVKKIDLKNYHYPMKEIIEKGLLVISFR